MPLLTDVGALYFLYGLGYILASLVGLAVGSVVSSVWLRLSAWWLELGTIPFGNAFRCCFLSNMVITMMHFSIGFNVGLSARYTSGRSGLEDVMRYSGFTSMYFLYAFVIGVVASACILRRFIKDEKGNRMTFGDAFTLAVVHSAVAMLFFLILVTLLFAIGLGVLDLLWTVV
ncbi:MAG: hypothetical protein AAF394_00935 [Planctomycetota bacterium]